MPLRWDACREDGLPKPPPGARLWVGLDLAQYHDSSALVALWWRDKDHRQVTACRVFEPPGGGRPLDARLVRETLLELHEHYRVSVVYEPSAGGAQLVQELAREHAIDVHEHGQTPKLLALAASRLLEAIDNGQLRHDGDATLRQHALGAVALPVGGEGVRFGRPAGPRVPIDALVALAMAHSVAVAEAPNEWPAGVAPFAYT